MLERGEAPKGALPLREDAAMKKSRIASVGLGLLVAIVLVLVLVLGLGLASIPSAAQDIGFERSRGKRMLNKVCKEVEKKFYDPELHGLDWTALCDQARRNIAEANSVAEIITIIFSVVDQLQDSHTKFIPPGRAASVLFGFEAKAFGDEVRVFWVKKNSAADRAGLQVGDRLLEVNGFVAERQTFDLMWLYMRGLRPVLDMQIVLSRGDESPRTIYVEGELKQKRILWEQTQSDFDVWAFLREADWEEEDFKTKNYEDGIGYLRLPYFTGRKLYKIFLKRKVDDIQKSRAVIIDLRDNGGGAERALAYLCSFFESEPTEIASRVGRKKTVPVKITPRRPSFPGPLFILVDSRSASAAEMFARHFQRTGQATVIGDVTSGRVNASLTYIYTIGTDTLIAYGLQVAEWRVVFPDGEELEKRGVTPDHICIPTGKDLREERDPCLDLALDLARKSFGTPTPEKSED